MSYRSITLASALALFPFMLHAQTDASPPSTDAMELAMTTPQSFAARAASGNQFEIMSSELALTMTQTPEVLAFAQRMIDDHTASGEKMMESAKVDGFDASATLMTDHRAQLDALSASEADSFDEAYLAAQVAAHNESVMLFQGYSERGEDGALQEFATQALPTLRTHLATVEPMSEN